MQTRITFSSTTGNSNAANLDWRSEFPARVCVTASSSTGAADYILQYTYDDLQLIASPTWRGISSAAGSTVAVHYNSTAIFDVGLVTSFANNFAGIRLSSTSNATTLTLFVGQSEGL